MASIISPAVPFEAAFRSGPAHVGSWIEIRGSVPPGADVFAANLKNAAGDIALHFNPRFGANKVVLNSAVSGCWGGEEHTELHCHHGSSFCLTFVFEPDGISTTLNGFHRCFAHRMPLTEVCVLEVRGDVIIDAVREGDAVDKHKPVTDVHVPGIVHITNGFTRGNKVIVKATPHGDFSINFQKDCAFDFGNIALHFNPRITNGTTVLNTTHGGNWGGEQVVGSCPLAAEVPALIEFVVKKDSYKIRVNGEVLAKYDHRSQYTNLEEIDTVFVSGPVTVHEVRLADDD